MDKINRNKKMQKDMIKITRNGDVYVDARLVECIFTVDQAKVQNFLSACNRPIINYIISSKEARTVMITDSGTIYISDIKTQTLKNRLSECGINLLCIVGSNAYISYRKIEALIDHDKEENYIPIFIEDKATSNTGQVIRSFVRMQSGHTYPSTFNQRTLIKKSRK